jgi:hemoglobin/transferrin/lactoferrin receptor protein
MRWTFAVLALALLPDLLSAQTVKVIDNTTLEPVADVRIFCGDKLVVTNSSGEADIGPLGSAGVITFQHPSYHEHKTTFAELETAGFEVRLKENIFSYRITVTAANKFEQNKREVPAKITNITDKEVEFQNPQTAADLLEVSDEVYIQKSQLGGGSPMIRGFATNRVLIVVDGVRMNNAIFRSGNLQNVISLDAQGIDSAEVVYGPGSVIYGSDAIGGVMDFHTRNPVLSLSDRLYASSQALTRYASAAGEKTLHYNLNIAGRRLGSITQVTYSDYGNLRMGSHGNNEYQRPFCAERIDGVDSLVENENPNIQRPSSYSQYNIMQKIRYRLDESWDIVYGFHYSRTSDVPRYDRLLEPKGSGLRSAEWYYGPQKWMLNSLSIKYTQPGRLLDEARLILAYQNYEESRNDRKFGDTRLNKRTENVDAASLNLDIYKRLGERDSLFYGAEVLTNSVGSAGVGKNIVTGAKQPISTRYPDGADWRSYAAYFNYKSNLCEKFTIIFGGRYNRVTLDAAFDKAFFPFPFDAIRINTGALNGNLGLVYRPDDSWQINVNLSTGFRAPNVDDAAKVFDSVPGFVVVPNENLKPEYAWNLDVGVVKSLGGRVHVEVTGFYTLLRDAMVRADFQSNGQDYIYYDGLLSRVQAVQNVDEATVYGLQGAFYADLSDNLTFKTHLTWMRGETRSGVPLGHVTPTFGTTHLIYRSGRFRADLYAEYNGSMPFERLEPAEREKTYMYAVDADGNPYSPSWFTLNLKVSRQINKQVFLSGGLENILDARYRPYSSGICAPGRNLIIALRYNF